MTYQKQIGLALAGCAVCAMPVLLPLIPKIGTYAASERLRAEEELQRATIAERAKTSEALYNAGIAPNATRVRMKQYLDNPNQDPKPDTTGYGAFEIIYVYDSAGVCIGKIEGNQWLWKHKHNNICTGDSN
ncbi:MAG: hypothetical protein KME57_36320 [Scytonema hyalinum WJT4-NPBG1]|nr:hypothetical protein [Scytonema hyalinum WJT4-NPBG1]